MTQLFAPRDLKFTSDGKQNCTLHPIKLLFASNQRLRSNFEHLLFSRPHHFVGENQFE